MTVGRGAGAAWAALGAAALLAGCASLAPTTAPGPAESLAGRLSVRVDATDDTPARGFAAGFELRGDAGAGVFSLTGPLGSLVARARWSPGQVVLATPQGERRYADLDGLTRDVLGESLPLVALFDWLRGRPWPGAASTAWPAAGGFDQLGWHVDLARFDAAQVAARREQPPVVTVRAQLERP